MTKIETNGRYYRHGRFAIPADSGAALDFYLRRLMVPHSRRELLLAPLARKSSLFGRMLFTNNGEKNADRNRPANGAALSPPELASVLVERLKAAGVKVGGDVKLLLLGDYVHSARRQSVVFVFDESSKTPVAVAKIGAAAHREALAGEFQTLKNLSRILPAALSRTVPEPLEIFTQTGFTVLLESALPGSSLHFEIRNDWTPGRRVAEEHFSAAFGWLTDFHRATFRRKIRFGELRGGEFADCFEKLRRDGETSKAEDAFLSEIMSGAARFDREEIPLSIVQGDFWTRNILIDGERLGVVDWEHSLTEGCSLDDAFMFAISYGRSYPRKFGRWLAPREAFFRTFYEKSWFAETVAAELRKFCAELGVTGKLLGVFLAAFLARQAVAEASKKGRPDFISEKEPSPTAKEKEVAPWRSLFREYAATKKNACFG